MYPSQNTVVCITFWGYVFPNLTGDIYCCQLSHVRSRKHSVIQIARQLTISLRRIFSESSHAQCLNGDCPDALSHAGPQRPTAVFSYNTTPQWVYTSMATGGATDTRFNMYVPENLTRSDYRDLIHETVLTHPSCAHYPRGCPL